MTDAVLDKLCGEGGDETPLTLLDLIARDTLDLELAAWLVMCVSEGASWITGSGPGGIGKTTIMRSLLSFVADGVALAEALPDQIGTIGPSRCCVVSHELSDHTPPTYLWDQDLRDYFSLGDEGHILVGNVHADHVDEIRAQIVDDCRVPAAQFRAIDLFAFVRMDGQDPDARRIKDKISRRYFNRIFWSDGTADHVLVFTPDDGLLEGPHRHAHKEQASHAWLEAALQQPDRTIQQLRADFAAR